MKPRLSTLCAALATALLAGSFYAGGVSAGEKEKHVQAPEAAMKLAKADNAFGLKLFKKLHKDGHNTFISPTSIATAVQMAGQAAAGDTRAEMDKAMELEGIDALASNKALMAELESRQGVKLAIANSIWADPSRISMNDAYVKEVQEYFDSEARVENFSDPKTLDVINGWISDKTNKLIPNMLDRISADTVSYLINAIYFKGDWTDKFKKENTKDADFHLADGSSKQVKLMSRKDEIKYAEDDKAQIACLPYGKDGNSAMWIVLPKEGTSLDALVTGLSDEQLKGWQNRAWEREGTIKLPRFKLRYKETLNDCLQGVGIVKAFDVGQADFKRMGESKLGPIFIGRVLHEAVVIVNEDGTEAAAATIVEMKAGGMPPKPWVMTCDRPFLFFITDEPTGAILFMGTCYNPDNPE
ncbi:MAG: serpin family protein [Planctomycetes bacterium]|nr:serpin family protein [Planctomycetota bacterium]MCB9936138.1 serpin family protein [Planctomycetota bacterium]